MNSLKGQKILAVMAFIEQISERLSTAAYVWGGLAVDIFMGRVLREISDVDYFIVDLQRLSGQFRKALRQEGWDTKTILDNHMLVARKDGILIVSNRR